MVQGVIVKTSFSVISRNEIKIVYDAPVIGLLLSILLTEEEAVEANVDPDVGKTVMEIIEARGYAVETHKVTTSESDGYILTIRIPKTFDESQSGSTAAANKPAVQLQHGLLDSSFTFVTNFRNQSLAYVLADAGYDVWLGNNRGTTCHTLNSLKRCCLTSFAPAWTRSASRVLVSSRDRPIYLNTTRIPVYLSQTPAGTSVQNMAHYAQGIRDDTFAKYDYGCSCLEALGIGLCSSLICENKVKYGSFDPPAFPIGSMVYPRTAFYIGATDTVATSTDIE